MAKWSKDFSQDTPRQVKCSVPAYLPPIDLTQDQLHHLLHEVDRLQQENNKLRQTNYDLVGKNKLAYSLIAKQKAKIDELLEDKGDANVK